jgi:hypothetical protein
MVTHGGKLAGLLDFFVGWCIQLLAMMMLMLMLMSVNDCQLRASQGHWARQQPTLAATAGLR